MQADCEERSRDTADPAEEDVDAELEALAQVVLHMTSIIGPV